MIVAIDGPAAAGKGTLARILSHLVGDQNVSVPNEKMLTDSAFTSHLVRKRLVVVHEIYAGGQTKKIYNNLKSQISAASSMHSASRRARASGKVLEHGRACEFAHFMRR